MSRRRMHLTWRAVAPHEKDSHDLSDDALLQTLYRPLVFSMKIGATGWEPSKLLEWVTVARGSEAHLRDVSDALNKARFEMFDLNARGPGGLARAPSIRVPQEGDIMTKDGMLEALRKSTRKPAKRATKPRSRKR